MALRGRLVIWRLFSSRKIALNTSLCSAIIVKNNTHPPRKLPGIYKYAKDYAYSKKIHPTRWLPVGSVDASSIEAGSQHGRSDT
jgi:hypothetical protein